MLTDQEQIDREVKRMKGLIKAYQADIKHARARRIKDYAATIACGLSTRSSVNIVDRAIDLATSIEDAVIEPKEKPNEP